MTKRSGDPVSGEEFRALIGMFATGVTVVTTVHQGTSYGTTASALSSVSLEPPTLLICMNRGSTTGQTIIASGHFAVNVLGEGEIAGMAEVEPGLRVKRRRRRLSHAAVGHGSQAAEA